MKKNTPGYGTRMATGYTKEGIKMKWKYTRRTINGKRCRVKVHRKVDGNYLVRKVGWRNRHD